MTARHRQGQLQGKIYVDGRAIQLAILQQHFR
jgi:hypothetical protein